MKQILSKFFESVLTGKNLTTKDQETLASFFVGELNELPINCVGIEFNPSELTFLAEHLIASDNQIFLGNFLRYNLAKEQYDEIIFLLSKMFVSHIGKNHYVSKNASSYDNLQKTFDRFIESCRWTNISFDEWKPMILYALKSDNSQLISKWKIPVKDYLTDWVVQDEKSFYNFLFDDFSEYGMSVFSALIESNVPSTLPKLVDFWLKNSFEEERQVKNILKSHFEDVEKYVQELEKNKEIQTADLVKILLVFSNVEDAKIKLLSILEKEKDASIKKQIVEGLCLTLPEKNVTLTQAKKNSQKVETQNLKFFGLKLNEFPKLCLKNGEVADEHFVAYFLQSYQNLFSPKASGELGFFRKFFDLKSLDEFLIFVAGKITTAKIDDDWVLCLLQNVSVDGAKKIMHKIIKDGTNNQKLLNKFVKQYIQDNKNLLLELFNSLSRQNHEEKLIQDVILKNMIESKAYSSDEIEKLKDKVVPNFDITPDGTYTVDGFVLKINKEFEVEISGTLSYSTLPKRVEIEQKRLSREIEKQIKRLEKAFHNARMWTDKEFSEFVLENKLVCFLSQKLVWGRYDGENLISVFCLEGTEKKNILSIEREQENSCLIGLFHPVELDDYDIKTMFYGKDAPFNQLYVQVNKMSSYNPHSSCVSKFNGFMVNFAEFFKKMKGFNWKLAVPTLDGYVSRLQKADEDLGLIAEIGFSPVSITNFNVSVVMGELRFYSIKDVIKTGNNYVVSKANSLELVAVPKRYFSDIVFEINISSKK